MYMEVYIEYLKKLETKIYEEIIAMIEEMDVDVCFVWGDCYEYWVKM